MLWFDFMRDAHFFFYKNIICNICKALYYMKIKKKIIFFLNKRYAYLFVVFRQKKICSYKIYLAQCMKMRFEGVRWDLNEIFFPTMCFMLYSVDTLAFF